jgi:hypothetical protein
MMRMMKMPTPERRFLWIGVEEGPR